MIDSTERDELVMGLAAEVQKIPRSERDGFLKNACQNDPELYELVSDVVTWEERMSGFLEHPLIEFVDLETLEEIFEPGQTVSGRFDILRRVGEGGMGLVYEAFDRKRKQRIAIKFAKPGFGKLLSPELEGALQVRHPNICVVNEIHTAEGEFGELDFLTMEFLDGETLSYRLERGRLNETEALEIARQLCAGAAEAHRSGILHRDLKPGNIILCQNKDGNARAVVTDFGLSTDSTIAAENEGGTPSYMAPELAHGGKASQASDVFALGVILYEMATGQKPFPARAGNNGTEKASPIVPSKLVKNLSRRWDAAILPCLRPEPEERCSAEQVLHVLQRKPLYRNPTLAVAIAACLVIGVLIIPRLVEMVKPAPIRLAMLPVEDSSGLMQHNQAMLDDVAQRVRQMQVGAAVSVIPLAKVQGKGVATPQEAKRILGATHAVQLKLRPETSGVAVEGSILDLNTMGHVRDYSAHFAQGDLDDLSSGITGWVAWAFRIHRKPQPETIAPAAVSACKVGREYLNRTPADFADAIPEFEKAAHLAPHSAVPLAGLAEAYIRKYQPTKDKKALTDAKFWLAKAEALNADSPAVRMASGLLYLIQGNYPRALEDYSRVEEIESDNAEAWLESGYAYESQGMLDKAMTDYRRAISVSPNFYKPYEFLGKFYFDFGRYAEAEGPYKKAIELAPERANGYGSLAGVYIAQFKYAEAEQVCKSLLQLKETVLQLKETALTLNNLGAMLAYQGKQKEALEYYQRAVKLDPNRAMYWLNVGDSQRRINEEGSARKSYRHALQLYQKEVIANPADASSRAYFAYLEARLGFRAEAELQIAQALNAPARDDRVVLMAVQTYEVLGEHDKARDTASLATAQTHNQIAHHPDLAGLREKLR